jgi:hypothetical protein
VRSARGGPAGSAAKHHGHCATPASRPHDLSQWKGGDRLVISLSAVAVLSVTVILLCRYAGLRISHAVICIVLGFYLASSSIAPEISRLTDSLFRLL